MSVSIEFLNCILPEIMSYHNDQSAVANIYVHGRRAHARRSNVVVFTSYIGNGCLSEARRDYLNGLITQTGLFLSVIYLYTF